MRLLGGLSGGDRLMGDTRTRVLLAVIRQRTPTVMSVADEVGRSKAIAYRHLLTLRNDGLVAWEPDRAGTLRPLVRRVAFDG